MDTTISRKARFRPRADAGLLSKLVQIAWTEYQEAIASKEEQDKVAEIIATYFETKIPPADFEVLSRYNCIAYHDSCNVRVYDYGERNAYGETLAPYREVFGIELPRKVPVLGTGGYGYPSLTACEPEWGTNTPLRELDAYFGGLLRARKQYKAEYKQSTDFPTEYKATKGEYPTWGEIEDQFPVLGAYLRKAQKRS
jgi:hypothetical protein